MRGAIRKAAITLIERYSLHDLDDPDDFSVNLSCLHRAFPPSFADFSERDMAGFVVPADEEERKDGIQALIYLHEGLDPDRQRLVYAHEVGHALLGHEGSLRLSQMDEWFTLKTEREAWQFSSLVLVPHSVVWGAAQAGWSKAQTASALRVPVWLVDLYPN